MKKLAIVGLLLVFGYFILRPYITFLHKTLHISIIRTLFPGDSFDQVNNQVNILILGIGGGTHDGPNLSDSITVLNYNMKTNIATSIGIPRDIWSEALRDKINSAYAYGEAKKKGGGIILAKAAVENITGLPIQHAVVIDFEKFRELIDYVGGVDIDVQHPFIDKKYPIAGKENDTCGGDTQFKCRYETIEFKTGMQHMDGATALKFVRSRNASGSEGSDFARNARQQLVLASIKQKVFGIFKSANPRRIEDLYLKIDSLVVRDLSNQQIADMAKHIVLTGKFSQRNFTLPQDLFEVPSYSDYDGKYVLIPKNKDYSSTNSYIICELEGKTDCLK